MELGKSMMISASGMRAQAQRLRVISENLANANSTSRTPGDEPYRRKIVTFRNVLDRDIGAEMVEPAKITRDPSEFALKYDPAHPAANADGYVQLPNVNGLIEMMDMREAQRSYEANLKVIEAARGMLMQTIDLLRG
jgi:flagellar basal-body rod protein FlgC